MQAPVSPHIYTHRDKAPLLFYLHVVPSSPPPGRFLLALGAKILFYARSEQVTKHAGSVQKGFALIGGILVTAVVQSSREKSALTPVRYKASSRGGGGVGRERT